MYPVHLFIHLLTTVHLRFLHRSMASRKISKRRGERRDLLQHGVLGSLILLATNDHIRPHTDRSTHLLPSQYIQVRR